MTDKARDLRWWEQAWVGHGVTILAVVMGGWLAGSQIRVQVAEDAAAERAQEIWKLKYAAYSEALDVVNKYFYSREYTVNGVKHQFCGPPPTSEEYGRALAKLRLLADDSRLAAAFIAALGAEGRDDGTAVSRNNWGVNDYRTLVRIMRDDLGTGPDPTPQKDFVLIDVDANAPERQQMCPGGAG